MENSARQRSGELDMLKGSQDVSEHKEQIDRG